MTIDDVQFLKSHADEHEYVGIIDSAKRDKSKYPTPSEYMVTFNTPFTNVFNVEILDMFLPQSGFIVDGNNNTLFFRFLTSETSNEDTDIKLLPSAYESISLTPSNYTSDTLIEELNVQFAKQARTSGRLIQVSPVSIPFSQTNKIFFDSDYLFEIEAGLSSASSVLGFGSVAGSIRAEQLTEFVVSRNVFFSGAVVHLESTNQVVTQSFMNVRKSLSFYQLIDVELAVNLDSFVFYFEVQGNLPSQSKFVVKIYEVNNAYDGTPSNLIDNISDLVFQSWISDVHEVMVQKDGKGYLSHSIQNRASLGQAQQDEFFQWTAKGKEDGEILLAGRTYALTIVDEVSDDPNNCLKLVYDFVPNVKPNTLFEINEDMNELTVLPKVNQQVSIQLIVDVKRHRLNAPGVVNLFGERYIQLRCPELEQHMHRSRAFETYNAGMALAITSKDYATSVRQMVTLPKREFHPIGKLQSFTFRFETFTGALYEFNGVDHVITMVIRYYRVQNTLQCTSYSLNPSYNPDLLQYLHNNVYMEEDLDEEEEQEQQHTLWPALDTLAFPFTDGPYA